jgi:Tat protein translocase TatB subunit
MNFFNIGTAELLLIFAIALIVVGPRRLPEIARSIGEIMRDLRQMSQEFTVDMMREIDAPPKSEQDESGKTTEQKTSEKPIQSLGEIARDVKKMSQDLTQEITRELSVSLDSEENKAPKNTGQNASEKPAQEDQA